MATSKVDHKEVQTDPNIEQNLSKVLQTLQTYFIAVNRYRLYLFNQYTQANQSCEHEDLLNVRKEILHRFQWVINELDQTIENFRAHRISDIDVQHIVNQPTMKEVIQTSLNADLSTNKHLQQSVSSSDEWRLYKRDLQETKEDLHILGFLVNRGISKIDRLVNVTNLFI